MKVALCTRRFLPPRSRQEGFTHLSPEARFDLVIAAEISSVATELVEFDGRYFVNTDNLYDGMLLFEEVKHEKTKTCHPMKHRFGPPETSFGKTCAVCGIHSNSTEGNRECHGAD